MSKNGSGAGGNKSRRSFILTLAIIAVIAYFIISLISLQIEIKNKEQQVETAQATLAAGQEENENLQALAEEDNEESYMEHIARDVLGYVFPGESVYYDTSSGN
ncbi:MAG: septum formation initiator family protein [Clostridia bacterium]|nr:septum formation initiator family protein [Clostridia bacterium]